MNIILKNALRNEIDNTFTPETVLRENSMATKMIQHYLKFMNGAEFLRKFCRPIIGMCLQRNDQSFPESIIKILDLTKFKLCFNQPYNDIEIDPRKIRKALPQLPGCTEEIYQQLVRESLKHNVQRIMAISQTVINFILTNYRQLPRSTFEISSMILQYIQVKFPNNVVAIRSAVSGFCFLRFICPALASPDSDVYKIIDPSENVSLANYESIKDSKLKAFKLPKQLDTIDRRRLILMTKIIQNLANGVIFGAKEQFMLPLNKILESAIPKRNTFLDALAANIRNINIEPETQEFTISEQDIDQMLADEEEDSDTVETDTNPLAAMPSEIDFTKVVQSYSQTTLLSPQSEQQSVSVISQIMDAQTENQKIVKPHSL